MNAVNSKKNKPNEIAVATITLQYSNTADSCMYGISFVCNAHLHHIVNFLHTHTHTHHFHSHFLGELQLTIYRTYSLASFVLREFVWIIGAGFYWPYPFLSLDQQFQSTGENSKARMTDVQNVVLLLAGSLTPQSINNYLYCLHLHKKYFAFSASEHQKEHLDCKN